jgi:hypothetical protein
MKQSGPKTSTFAVNTPPAEPPGEKLAVPSQEEFKFTTVAPPLSALGPVMTADEVLRRLSAQARGTLTPFLVESEGAFFPDLRTERAQANLFLLKKAKFKRRSFDGGNPRTETEVELELHDAQTALRDLGRHHKLFSDRTESVAVEVLKVEIEYVDPK